ncbi:MAG: hypothetical protein IPG12_10695 [Saprospiraceae bacterium]|nr:hypothetical protein [Saprospiraceae bacterium]
MKKPLILFLFILNICLFTFIVQKRFVNSRNQELEAVKITVLGKHKLSSAPDFNFLKGISENGDTLCFVYLSQKIYNLLQVDSTYLIVVEPDSAKNGWLYINKVL